MLRLRVKYEAFVCGVFGRTERRKQKPLVPIYQSEVKSGVKGVF